MFRQESIGREAAIALGETGWWNGKPESEVFERQMQTEELIMEFGEFQRIAQVVLGRPVWTHEFARPDMLWDEYRGGHKVEDPLAHTLSVLTDIMSSK